jgi:hypothetical protein
VLAQSKDAPAAGVKKTAKYPALVNDLKALVEPHTSGSPMRPLLWASRSLAHLTGALKQKGTNVSTYVTA